MENQSLNTFFYGADTVFWSCVNLFINDIHDSKTSDGFFYKTRPIQKVSIAGIIISLAIQSNKFTVQIGDGSGVINCVYWYSDEEKKNNPVDFGLGDLISIQGRITEYRDEIQITIKSGKNTVKFKKDDLKSSSFSSCIKRKVKKWKFDSKCNGITFQKTYILRTTN